MIVECLASNNVIRKSLNESKREKPDVHRIGLIGLALDILVWLSMLLGWSMLFCTYPVEADAKSPLSTDIVANLLDEYEYETEGKEDFWMEPSESSHLCVGVILQPGVYLAMVTFVGDHSDDEFWRRLFIVQIPERDTLSSEEARM